LASARQKIESFNCGIELFNFILRKLNKKAKTLISRCPFCDGELEIARLSCHSCDTEIDSSLSVPAFFRLPPDLQEFVVVFLRCRGNIREAEKELGISYPTVCKRLDLVNELLGNASRSESAPVNRREILQQVEDGKLTAREAARLLRDKNSA